MEAAKETGFQAPEGPILCVNNCGFFGSAATMNMCSKCHKDKILKQEQEKLATSSLENIINGSNGKGGPAIPDSVNPDLPAVAIVAGPGQDSSFSSQVLEAKPKEGPNRCAACCKKVGLMGFSCRCGNLFCSAHRYSDKHDCSFDYQMEARDAIAKANPVVKARKLDKI